MHLSLRSQPGLGSILDRGLTILGIPNPKSLSQEGLLVEKAAPALLDKDTLIVSNLNLALIQEILNK